VVAALLLGSSLAVAGQTVVLQPMQDNTLIQDATGDTSNGSGPAIFAGENSQGRIRRAVLRFDVAGTLPAGSRINHAELVLTVSNAPNDNPVTMTLHRVVRSWGEGRSAAEGGRGTTASTSDATWLHAFYPDAFWSQPGGDFGDTVRASASVGGAGTASWSGAGVVEDVQAWLDDPDHNFGWLLKGDESTGATARRFASRECPEASERPALIIDYQAPDQLQASTWGAQKSRWVTSPR
jgi:hypothetical protein